MILSKSFLDKFIKLRNLNILVYGTNIKLFDQFKINKQYINKICYYSYNDIYYIECIKNLDILNFINDLIISPNYYSKKINKKIIILINIQNLQKQIISKINYLSDKSYNTTCFIFHTNQHTSIDITMKSRSLVFSLPKDICYDKTIQITYNRIIDLLKLRITKDIIHKIREICYMYYMNHTDSIKLQKLIITNIGKNLYLPNIIKYKVIKDIVYINYLYQYSYRKPIFLECIIYSLYNNLNNYTYNL